MGMRAARDDAQRGHLAAMLPSSDRQQLAAASDYSGAASLTANDKGSHAPLRAFSRRRGTSA